MAGHKTAQKEPRLGSSNALPQPRKVLLAMGLRIAKDTFQMANSANLQIGISINAALPNTAD